MNDLHIPDGWTLEPMTGMRDHVVLSAPAIGAVTFDFRCRGFRGGMFTLSGPFVGQEFTRRGVVLPKYEGRGWKQRLVDAAVAWLKEAA